jgi:hypothetical protein
VTAVEWMSFFMFSGIQFSKEVKTAEAEATVSISEEKTISLFSLITAIFAVLEPMSIPEKSISGRLTPFLLSAKELRVH